MKPLGLRWTYNPRTQDVGMRVHHPTRTEDAIWDAVREAINEGWTVEQFKIEAAQAWQETLEDEVKQVMEKWSD